VLLKNEECIPWDYIRHRGTLYAQMMAHGRHVQPLAGPEKAFGEAFRKLRKKNGISQEAVSEEAQCDRTTVSLIERGLVSAKLVTVVKMCKAIAVLPSEVMRAMEKSHLYL
jgi:DNA-binding XRE family transcriptional regulator